MWPHNYDGIPNISSFLAFCLIAVASFIVLLRKRRSREDDPYAIEPCPNPHCVRCQNYETVQQQALRKLKWVSADSRVAQAIRNGRRHEGVRQSDVSPAMGQYATVFLVPGLATAPNVTAMHPDARRTLQSAIGDIRSELSAAQSSRQLLSMWNENDTTTSANPSTPWSVLHLMNQGRWDSHLTQLFPNTANVVKSIPNVLDNSCIFGNVFFSRMGQNTQIHVHCGPTNVRHRMHLTLQLVGASPTLQVRNELFQWRTDDIFVFDDSLRHQVDADESCRERIVLIVDLWHPDISVSERSAISHLYPMVRKV